MKAGSTGSLRSLHQFMAMKKLPLALRINGDLPSITQVNVKQPDVSYRLISLPFYLTEQIPRLLGLASDSQS